MESVLIYYDLSFLVLYHSYQIELKILFALETLMPDVLSAVHSCMIHFYYTFVGTINSLHLRTSLYLCVSFAVCTASQQKFVEI